MNCIGLLRISIIALALALSSVATAGPGRASRATPQAKAPKTPLVNKAFKVPLTGGRLRVGIAPKVSAADKTTRAVVGLKVQANGQRSAAIGVVAHSENRNAYGLAFARSNNRAGFALGVGSGYRLGVGGLVGGGANVAVGPLAFGGRAVGGVAMGHNSYGGITFGEKRSIGLLPFRFKMSSLFSPFSREPLKLRIAWLSQKPNE